MKSSDVAIDMSLTANVSNTNILANNKVHSWLVRFTRVSRPVLEDGR